MTNFEKIHDYFSKFESPQEFIDIGYLFCVSSCLGRKVWLQGGLPIYPNIQTALIGPPSIGKTLPTSIMLDLVRSLHDIVGNSKIPQPLIHVAPKSITLEKLYEKLERCGEAIPKEITGDKPYFHSSMAFFLEGEMGDLFKPGPATQVLTLFLNSGYDCLKRFDYETKRSGENHVTNLCVNFLGCATPDWIEKNLDSAVIGNGWSSRVVWIYGDERRQLTTFYNFTDTQKKSLDDIGKHFRVLAKIFGEIHMSPECHDAFNTWYQKNPQKNRINNDSKLDHYYGRKKLHLLKFMMAFHFAENTTKVIEIDSFNRALAFLNNVELSMHKALSGIGSNPTAKVATDMLRLVETAGEKGMTWAEIINEVYSKSPEGLKSIEEAKTFLFTTNKIKQDGTGRWFLNQKIVGVDFKKAQTPTGGVTEEEIRKVAQG